MRELWVLEHSGWKLPISVETECDCDIALVRVGFGLRMLDCQRAAAGWVLDAIGRRNSCGSWVIGLNDLANVAAPAAMGVSAEQCVVWPGFGRIEDEPDVLTFSKSFFRNGYVPSEPLAEYLLMAVAKHAAWWLMDRRTLDFGFCVIDLLPLRVNWKQMILRGDLVHGKKRKIARHLVRKGITTRKEWLRRAMLHAPRLLAIDEESKRIHWTVEIRFTNWFRKMVNDREKQRAEIDGYYRRVMDDVKKYREQVLQIYESFVDEMGHPQGKMCGGTVTRSGVPLPRWGAGTNHHGGLLVKARIENNSVAVVVRKKKGSEAHLARATVFLQAVSDFRRAQKDLRDDWITFPSSG